MARRLTKREQIITAVTIAVLAGLFIFNSGTDGLVSPFEQIDQDTAVQKELYLKGLEKLEQTNAINHEYLMLKNKFLQNTTDEQFVSGMIQSIESVAQRLGLQISQLKPAPKREGDYYAQFSISLSMESELLPVMEFIHQLQSEPYLMDVEQLKIERKNLRASQEMSFQLVLSQIAVPQ